MSFMQRQLGSDEGFGHALRELREQRGISRESLAETTKIHTSIIEALEEERFEELKDSTYAERHVRALVKALEGRPGYFLLKYREALRVSPPTGENQLLVHPRVRRRDLFVASRVVTLFGFLCLVALASGYLIWQGKIFQDAPSLTIMAPEEGTQLTMPRVDVRGETAPGAMVTVNGRDAVVSPDGLFTVSFDVPRGLTTITVEARRRYGASVVETRRVTYLHELFIDSNASSTQ